MRLTFFLCAWFPFAAMASAADNPTGLIVNLYDAFGKEVPGTQFGWGYSALIRFQGKTISFDSGGDADRFGRNAKALNIDLKMIDYAVLSHNHGDHSSGFDYVL